MEFIADKRVLQSKPFKFRVGPEKKEFFLHSDIVNKHSRTLDFMINGRMLESVEGVAIMEDVDVETFTRFAWFVYTGDYEPAHWYWQSGISSADIDASYETKIYSTTNPGKRKRTKKYKCERCSKSSPVTIWVEREPPEQGMWAKFEKAAFCARVRDGVCAPYRNSNPYQVFKDVFVSHAQVYVFADRYDIRELGQLALDKLHRSLVHFNLYHQRLEDIVELVRYTYANTAEMTNGRRDGLRKLVTCYLCCKVPRYFKECNSLDVVMSEYPDIGLDLKHAMVFLSD